jgi:hypothetical protein
MTRLADRPDYHHACDRFVAAALRADDSLFTPGAAVWATPVIDDFHRRFVANPDESSAKFIPKLTGQLTGADRLTVQLAAEVMFVYLMPADSIGAPHKESLVAQVLAIGSLEIDVPDDLAAAYATGIATVGTAFNTQRDKQFSYLLEFMRAWKVLAPEVRAVALEDPWEFKNQAFAVTDHSGFTMRDALLHVVHPATFEPIVSRNHKAEIAKAFATVAGESSDVDRRLESIRAALSPTYGEGFSFYMPELIGRWQAGKAIPWDEFVRWAGKLLTWEDFDEKEVAYKRTIAANLAAARDALGRGQRLQRLQNVATRRGRGTRLRPNRGLRAGEARDVRWPSAVAASHGGSTGTGRWRDRRRGHRRSASAGRIQSDPVAALRNRRGDSP